VDAGVHSRRCQQPKIAIRDSELPRPNWSQILHPSCRITLAEDIVVGDLSDIAQDEIRRRADQQARWFGFDAVIHNAGISYREPNLVKTVDGLPQLFAVKSLAPYILTILITMPKRLVYLSQVNRIACQTSLKLRVQHALRTAPGQRSVCTDPTVRPSCEERMDDNDPPPWSIRRAANSTNK
jgi:hypothetical protein